MARAGAAAATLTIRWSGRPRTLALRPWSSLVLLVAMPLLAAWYLGASLYLVFHDDLLAALIARQTATQYAYEDRIAALKAELEATTGDLASGQEASSGALDEVRARAARLEARATTLEQLAARLGPDAASATAPLVPRLRLGSADESAAATLARAEAAQEHAAHSLREPAQRKIVRMQAALAETGLPSSRWKVAPAGIGGPFVPLDEGMGFDGSLALLRDATTEAARLESIVAHVPLRRPLEGRLEVTSTFGPRLDPFLGRAAMHTGIDLREETGDAVMATADGIVTIAGPDGGYGNMVELDHGGGLSTRYAHLSAVEVTIGQRVGAGAMVGRVGATGRATGPHLHYETRIDATPVNPARFLQAAAILSPQR